MKPNPIEREPARPTRVRPVTSLSDNNPQLLYSREDARRLLGNVSVMTLIRLERRGVLKPVRLNPKSKAAMVFYKRADLLRLANGGVDAE